MSWTCKITTCNDSFQNREDLYNHYSTTHKFAESPHSSKRQTTHTSDGIRSSAIPTPCHPHGDRPSASTLPHPGDFPQLPMPHERRKGEIVETTTLASSLPFVESIEYIQYRTVPDRSHSHDTRAAEAPAKQVPRRRLRVPTTPREPSPRPMDVQQEDFDPFLMNRDRYRKQQYAHKSGDPINDPTYMSVDGVVIRQDDEDETPPPNLSDLSAVFTSPKSNGNHGAGNHVQHGVSADGGNRSQKLEGYKSFINDLLLRKQEGISVRDVGVEIKRSFEKKFGELHKNVTLTQFIQELEPRVAFVGNPPLIIHQHHIRRHQHRLEQIITNTIASRKVWREHNLEAKLEETYRIDEEIVAMLGNDSLRDWLMNIPCVVVENGKVRYDKNHEKSNAKARAAIPQLKQQQQQQQSRPRVSRNGASHAHNNANNSSAAYDDDQNAREDSPLLGEVDHVRRQDEELATHHAQLRDIREQVHLQHRQLRSLQEYQRQMQQKQQRAEEGRHHSDLEEKDDLGTGRHPGHPQRPTKGAHVDVNDGTVLSPPPTSISSLPPKFLTPEEMRQQRFEEMVEDFVMDSSELDVIDEEENNHGVQRTPTPVPMTPPPGGSPVTNSLENMSRLRGLMPFDSEDRGVAPVDKRNARRGKKTFVDPTDVKYDKYDGVEISMLEDEEDEDDEEEGSEDGFGGYYVASEYEDEEDENDSLRLPDRVVQALRHGSPEIVPGCTNSEHLHHPSHHSVYDVILAETRRGIEPHPYDQKIEVTDQMGVGVPIELGGDVSADDVEDEDDYYSLEDAVLGGNNGVAGQHGNGSYLSIFDADARMSKFDEDFPGNRRSTAQSNGNDTASYTKPSKKRLRPRGAAQRVARSRQGERKTTHREGNGARPSSGRRLDCALPEGLDLSQLPILKGEIDIESHGVHDNESDMEADDIKEAAAAAVAAGHALANGNPGQNGSNGIALSSNHAAAKRQGSPVNENTSTAGSGGASAGRPFVQKKKKSKKCVRNGRKFLPPFRGRPEQILFPANYQLPCVPIPIIYDHGELYHTQAQRIYELTAKNEGLHRIIVNKDNIISRHWLIEANQRRKIKLLREQTDAQMALLSERDELISTQAQMLSEQNETLNKMKQVLHTRDGSGHLQRIEHQQELIGEQSIQLEQKDALISRQESYIAQLQQQITKMQHQMQSGA